MACARRRDDLLPPLRKLEPREEIGPLPRLVGASQRGERPRCTARSTTTSPRSATPTRSGKPAGTTAEADARRARPPGRPGHRLRTQPPPHPHAPSGDRPPVARGRPASCLSVAVRQGPAADVGVPPPSCGTPGSALRRPPSRRVARPDSPNGRAWRGSLRSARRRASAASARRRSRRREGLPSRAGARPRRRSRVRSRAARAASQARPGRSGTRVRRTRNRPATARPRRMTEMSIVASMFPPESTGTTLPSPPTLPWRSAATPTAPAPSTTSFVRSSSSTIDSVISSSVTETMSSSTRSRMLIVSSPGFLTAIPSAIVKPGPSGSVPAACTPTMPHAGPHGAQRERDAGGEPAAADRDHDRAGVRHLLGELEPDRPLARRSRRVSSNGWTNVAPVCATYACAPASASSMFEPAQLDLGAVVARRVDLGHRRVLRHEDPRVRADLARSPRDRLAVVAGARGDDACRALVVARASRSGCTRRAP